VLHSTYLPSTYPKPQQPYRPELPGGARRITSDLNNPLRTVAGLVMLVFLFTVQARLLEIFYVPGLAMILALLALSGGVMGGDVMGAGRSRVGIFLIAFSIWMIAISPLSVWPGGSFHMLKEIWIKNVLVFFILVSVLITSAECLRVFYVLAAATVTIVLLSFKYATMTTGRLKFITGTLANSNDLAAYLLVGAPFCLLALQRSGPIMKAVWLASLALLVNLVLKTGSRAGLLTLGFILVYMFIKARPLMKLAMGTVAICAVLAAPFLLPQSVLDRYALIFSTSSANELDSKQAEYAAGSTEGRTRMLQLSLQLTASNPLFGVGPGMFAVAASDEAKELGERAAWLQTHNLYTQVSSETGLPGFFLYIAVLAIGLRNLSYVQKWAGQLNPDLSAMASWARISYLAFLVTGLFSSTAFQLNIIILLAISQALRNAADLEIQIAPPIPVHQTRPVQAVR
jgi:putative inorganic carbon (HCO3(-)) transporter